MSAWFVWTRTTAVRVVLASVVVLVSSWLLGFWWTLFYVGVVTAWVTLQGGRLYRKSTPLPAHLLPVDDSTAPGDVDVRLVPEGAVGGAGALWTAKRQAVLVTPTVTELPPEQMRAVIAHEKGHLASIPLLDDIAIVVLILAVVRTVPTLGSGVMAFVVGTTALVSCYLLLMFMNREAEKAADAWAVCHGVNPGVLAEVLEQLAANYPAANQENPSRVTRLLASHPPVRTRTALLRSWM